MGWLSAILGDGIYFGIVAILVAGIYHWAVGNGFVPPLF